MIGIKRIKKLLDVDYTFAVVEKSIKVIKLVKKYNNKDINYTFLRDIIMSSPTDESERDLLYKTVFALVNIKVLDMEYVNILDMEILPFDEISKSIMFPELQLVYKDPTSGKEIELYKEHIELVLRLL